MSEVTVTIDDRYSEGYADGWNECVEEIIKLLAERLDIINLLERDSAEIQIITRAVKQMSDK
jgi:hypothetical protein